MDSRPNIIIILNDDMGYSDIGCYGGEVQTPNLDTLAQNGIRFTHFCNTARCSPSRASLLTGLHPHQTGIGILVNDDRPEGYAGTLNRNCVTIAEVLKAAGYGTYMSGKWHVVHDRWKPNAGWPNGRGFDEFYGIIHGATSYFYPTTLYRNTTNVEAEARADPGYYITDAISDAAARFIGDHVTNQPGKPFFLYVAYTAPHWPLHAKDADIARYKGRFDAGWDVLREQRLQRMAEMGIVGKEALLSPRDGKSKPWAGAENKEWEERRMEVYAAQIDCMDQGIGRIVKKLEETGQIDNTLIVFLSDNGGCAEGMHRASKAGITNPRRASGRAETKDGRPVRFGNVPDVIPGPEDTYASYGPCWANLSNTPFRKYKHWAHEGGIATPFIAHWPAGIALKGGIIHRRAQLTDIMPTILEITGAAYPAEFNGQRILPVEGTSMVPLFRDEPNGKGMIFLEHEGNAAVIDGKWKLVRDFPGSWELHDMEADRSELHDVSKQFPDRLKAMARAYDEWAKRCGVIPRERYIKRAYLKGIGGFLARIYMARERRRIDAENKRLEAFWKGQLGYPPRR
ncbi:MAG: arylsulfatase [Candidatus Lokiarchaeota archaeon]|nr:arylsulfatase [Candidatus Lokiarchaeota archaeon]